ncbi:hypothetical protein PINS_up008401 [Pythium insidiosum]|nr:hypothetical protein PINS_up008401 [Pythium insidiosum]
MRRLTTKHKNSCAVKVDSSGCVEKRSCRDCLSPSLQRDKLSCYLDAASGDCSTFEELPLNETAKAQVLAAASATQRHELLERMRIFTADRVRYCSVSDRACVLCEAVVDLPGYQPSSAQIKSMSEDRKICYGSDGCLCLSRCESSQWWRDAGSRCSAQVALPSYSTPSPQSRNIQSKLLTFIGVFILSSLSSRPRCSFASAAIARVCARPMVRTTTRDASSRPTAWSSPGGWRGSASFARTSANPRVST